MNAVYVIFISSIYEQGEVEYIYLKKRIQSSGKLKVKINVFMMLKNDNKIFFTLNFPDDLNFDK